MSESAKIIALYERIRDLQSLGIENGLDQTVSDLSFEIAHITPESAIPLYSALVAALLERIE